MNINARTLKLKIPQIFFNRVFSNSLLIFVVSFSVANFIFGLMGNNSFSMMGVFLFNFIFVLVGALGAVGPGEAMKEPSYSSDEDNRAENLEDFKRMGIYLTIYVLVVVTINAIFTPIHIGQKVVNIHVPIKSVKFIDVHEADVDKFSIRYFGQDGKRVFTETYNKETDRNYVYNKIFDKTGKVIVNIDYYNRNSKKFVEISAKAIEL